MLHHYLDLPAPVLIGHCSKVRFFLHRSLHSDQRNDKSLFTSLTLLIPFYSTSVIAVFAGAFLRTVAEMPKYCHE